MLNAKQIEKEIKRGNIKIDPFNPKFLGPNSYDLTLGQWTIKYKKSFIGLDNRPVIMLDNTFYNQVFSQPIKHKLYIQIDPKRTNIGAYNRSSWSI